VSGGPGAVGEQGDLVSRLRAVIEAKDAQIAVLIAGLETSREREPRFYVRVLPGVGCVALPFPISDLAPG
jgi:hypothetical protein